MTQTTAEDLLRRTLPLLSTHSPDNDNKLICDILNHLQKFPPCLGCGATTTQEAKARCTRTTAKDVCHGCELWPDEIVFDAPKPLAVEGVQALAEEILRHWQPPQPPTLSTEKLYREIDQLLGDMTRCSDHPEGGWWETEDGVKVGRIKLRELKELITRHLSPPQP